jgi:hypothetical protein
MGTRILRWIGLITTALPLGATTAHVMELPNKVMLDGPLWLAIQQNLYRGWGPVAGPFEIVAALTAWVLVYRARGRRPAFALTLVAALCLSGMIAVFFIFNAPVNAAVAGWTAATLPPDWPDYRLRWESGHAVSFVLALVAFCALLRTAFVDVHADAMQRRGWDRPAALVDDA